MLNILISIVSNALETHAPIVKKFYLELKKRKNMQNAGWFEKECEEELRRKENTPKIYQKNKMSGNFITKSDNLYQMQ